jgi:benzoyl-CoA reductase/2-hydroxyglutaryl-CoA dehydratase subunit BcrC/BadD/HgdB
VGGLPRPDLLLVITTCNTHLKWWEDLSHYFNVPLMVTDTPYIQDGMSDEEIDGVVDYTKAQLQEHIGQLQELTGRKFDWDAYQQAIAYAREASLLYEKFVTSTRNVPSPITSFDTFLHLGPLMVARGFPEPIEYYKTLTAEVEERVRTKVSAIGEEVYRLYWDNIPVWFKVGYLGRKFAGYGAALVAAKYPMVWIEAFSDLDPENPLDSIARSQTLVLLNRGTQYRIDLLRRLLSDYKVDAMVMQMSRTCKPFIMEQVVISKEAERQSGLPSVVIEGDMVDSRLFDEAEVDNRIDSFMEVVARSKN